MSAIRSERVREFRGVDVAVLGGGPAGAATALLLARAGLRVLLLEKTRYEGLRPGEMLAPSAQARLEVLGVWDSFQEAGHLPVAGLVSVWGGAEPCEQDFLFLPHGRGWQLDRTRFDIALAEAARQADATVITGVSVLQITPETPGGWSLVFSPSETEIVHTTARFLVWATGRASGGMLRRESHRLVYDRLVGIAGAYSPPVSAGVRDHRTWIEAFEEGWWYSAVHPDGGLLVVAMTDRDLWPASPAAWPDYWSAVLSRTVLTQERVADHFPMGALRLVAANSYLRRPIAGPAHLVLGDSAATRDPLAGQGILRALDAALHAAPAISGHLAGDWTALKRYSDQVYEEYSGYLQRRRDYYLQEQRWLSSPFWARRTRFDLARG